MTLSRKIAPLVFGWGLGRVLATMLLLVGGVTTNSWILATVDGSVFMVLGCILMSEPSDG